MPNPNDEKSPTITQLVELINKQNARIDTLEKSLNEAIEFNKALLNSDGAKASPEEDDDSETKAAKEKLEKFLEE